MNEAHSFENFPPENNTDFQRGVALNLRIGIHDHVPVRRDHLTIISYLYCTSRIPAAKQPLPKLLLFRKELRVR